MALIWNQAESRAFQSQLGKNLDAWDQTLSSWKTRIESAASRLGTELQGEAVNAIRTLFVDRILPIVESGQSACAWTRQHLATYAAAELQLIQETTALNEDDLQSSIDGLNDEIANTHPVYTDGGSSREEYEAYEETIRKLRLNVQIAQRKLDALRNFEATTASLFNEEIRLTATLSSAISSIARGSLRDGIYTPALGDREPWRDAVGDYLAYHPLATDPQTTAGIMEQRLRDAGLLEGETNQWYDEWLLNAARRGISIDEIIKIAQSNGITPEDFTVFDGLEELKDPDGKSFFLLPPGTSMSDAMRAAFMTYILNAGTDYAVADDPGNPQDRATTRNDYAETPYSSAEAQRVAQRIATNWSSYIYIDGASAITTTPYGTLMGLGGSWLEQVMSQDAGTTYGDVLLVNIDNSSDPVQTLRNIIAMGSFPQTNYPEGNVPGDLDLDRLLHHEEQHSEQWARHIDWFALSYFEQWFNAGGNGSWNYWEQNAGLEDGGYKR